MAGHEVLPDEAVVVRCGRPPFETNPLHRACGQHPEGPYGFSVQSDCDQPWELLASNCMNHMVGVVTVRAIRASGYDVIPSGRRREGDFHATVVVPRDWSVEASLDLADLFQPEQNPSSRRKR